MKFTRMFTLFTLVSFSIIALFRLELVAQEPQVQDTSRSAEVPLVEKPGTTDGEFSSPIASVPDGLEQVDENVGNTSRTYYVGDLVVPMTPEKMDKLFETGEVLIPKQAPRGITQQDFLPLIELIESTIRPESWKENSSVQAFAPKLSLIVSQNRRGHDELQDLLAKLRELSDIVLQLESHFVVVDKTAGLKAGGSNVAISAKDFERKISAAADNALARSTYIVKCFNGQGFAVGGQKLDDYQIAPINFQMVVTADRQAVRVFCSSRPIRAQENDLQAGSGELQKESPGDSRPQTNGTAADHLEPLPLGILEVASEGHATFDITPALVGGNDNGNRKAFMIVRPTISVRGR